MPRRGKGWGELVSEQPSDWTIIQDGNLACDWTRIQDGEWKSSHLIGQ